ncbi:MAG: peptidoglycan-binding protein [Clostridia bacterium]|nr:peptidoglycan-binding protein [Clostridia bacterium]
MTEHPNHSSAVSNLQRYLRQLSYEEPSISPVPLDGIFASQTEEALREFQRLRGLSPTGKADRETWERLYEDYRASLAKSAPPQPILIFPLSPPGYVILPGSRGVTVSVIQQMLRELHHHYLDLQDVEATGTYDPQTRDAIRFFQEKNTLPANGNVDLLTWNALADQYNTLFSRASEE